MKLIKCQNNSIIVVDKIRYYWIEKYTLLTKEKSQHTILIDIRFDDHISFYTCNDEEEIGSAFDILTQFILGKQNYLDINKELE